MPSDEDPVVNCVLNLEVINNALCNSYEWTLRDIQQWQLYMFHFGVLMTSVLMVDVKNEVHRLMRNGEHDLVHLGCIRRESSKENEMTHMEFKVN